MNNNDFDPLNLKYHPACEIFPTLSNEELQSLADDIKANGLLEPIVVYKGEILDGRNRYEACEVAGVEPQFVAWDGEGSPAAYVISKNLQRRNLTASQRAVIAYELLPLLEAEAKERQRLSNGRGKKGGQNCSTEIGKASEHAAKIGNCSSTYIEQVKATAANAPELLDAIRNGVLTVDQAHKLSKIAESKRQAVVEKAKKPKARIPRLIRQAEIECRKEQRKEEERTITVPKESTIQIMNGDCLAIMRDQLKPKSVQVVITSIPYNIGVKYDNYEDSKDDEHYLDWLDEVFKMIESVLVDDGSFFLNLGRTSQKPWLAHRVLELLPCRFQLQNEIIWAKAVTVNDRSYGQFRPVPGKRFLTPTHEHIYHLTKRGDVEIDRLALGVPYSHVTGQYRFKNFEDTRCGGTIWTIPFVSTKSREGKWSHPCPFPVELPIRCMKMHGIKEGMTVLDPFNGVGSSTTAMVRFGVTGIGIDIDEGYCQTAKARLLDEQAQLARLRAVLSKKDDTGLDDFLYLRTELTVILEDCIDLGGQSTQQNIQEFFSWLECERPQDFNVVLASIESNLREFYQELPSTLAA